MTENIANLKIEDKITEEPSEKPDEVFSENDVSTITQVAIERGVKSASRSAMASRMRKIEENQENEDKTFTIDFVNDALDAGLKSANRSAMVSRMGPEGNFLQPYLFLKSLNLW